MTQSDSCVRLNVAMYLTCWAVTGQAGKHRTQIHRLGPPGPRRGQLVGHASVTSAEGISRWRWPSRRLLTLLLHTLLLADATTPDPATAEGYGVSMVSLTSEEIRMQVTPESVLVHGTYLFKRINEFPACPVYFPFPRDSTMTRPRLLRATVSYGDGASRPLPVDDRQTPWFSEPHTGSAETFKVNLLYSQQLTSPQAEYPLTSRYRWFTPSDSIRIEVELPASASHQFSLPFERIAGDGDSTTYGWSSIRLPLPDRDLVVRWKPHPAWWSNH
jgi:hypothetical protein